MFYPADVGVVRLICNKTDIFLFLYGLHKLRIFVFLYNLLHLKEENFSIITKNLLWLCDKYLLSYLIF